MFGRELLSHQLLLAEWLHRSRNFLTQDVLLLHFQFGYPLLSFLELIAKLALRFFFLLLNKQLARKVKETLLPSILWHLLSLNPMLTLVTQNPRENLTNILLLFLDIPPHLYPALPNSIRAKFLLVPFFTSNPKQLLVELPKFLKQSPISLVLFVVLRHQNGRIDHLHHKFSVLFIFRQYYLFGSGVPFVLNFNIVTDPDAAGPDQVVLLVVSPVHIGDHLPHARSASRGRRLGVVVSLVDQDVFEDLLR